MGRNQDIIWQFLSGAIFFSLLSFVYLSEISVKFSYAGFLREISLPKTFLAVQCLVIVSLSLSDRLNVRNFLWMFVIYSGFIPGLVLFAFGGASYSYLLVMVSGFAIIWWLSRIRTRRVLLANVSGRSLLAGFFCAILGTILLMVLFGAHRYFSLSIRDVYLYRRDTSELLPGFFGYIMSPVSKIMLPAGMALAAYYKEKLLIFVLGFLTIIYFGLTHHKSILLAPFLTLGLFVFLQHRDNHLFLRILFILAAALGAAEVAVLQWVLNSDQIAVYTTFILRRVFIVPAFLDNMYVDFFSQNPFYYWSTSSITLGLVPRPYDVSAPFLIGRVFFGNPDMSANSGFIASGFSNAGILGVCVYATIIGLIMSQLQSQGRVLGAPVTIGITVITITSVFRSTDLVTAILTHGLLFLFLVLSLMPRSRQEK